MRVNGCCKRWAALSFAAKKGCPTEEAPEREGPHGCSFVHRRSTDCCARVLSGHGEEKPRIYLGASSKTLGYSPLWVASKKGFFDQQGLDVQVVLLRGVPMTVQALVGGSLHFGSGGPEPYIEAQSAAWIWWSPGGSSMVSPNLSSRPRITGRTKICVARPLVSPL